MEATERQSDILKKATGELESHVPAPTLDAISALRNWNSPHLMMPFAIDWAVIILCVAAWRATHILLLVPILVCIIAARQHALAVLMHETVHSKAAAAKFIGSLCAWSLFVSWNGYRNNHLAHHRFVNTDRDPDFAFKRRTYPADWEFPRRRWSLVVLLIKDLVGNGLLANFQRIMRLGQRSVKDKTSGRKDALWLRLSYTVGFVAFWIFSFGFVSFALFWVLPLFTVLPFLLRIRSIAEHFGIPEQAFEKTRNVRAGWVERELIGLGPHGVGLHLTHHLFPDVPSYHLKKADSLLRQSWSHYNTGYHHCDGYFLGRRTLVRDLLVR